MLVKWREYIYRNLINALGATAKNVNLNCVIDVRFGDKLLCGASMSFSMATYAGKGQRPLKQTFSIEIE